MAENVGQIADEIIAGHSAQAQILGIDTTLALLISAVFGSYLLARFVILPIIRIVVGRTQVWWDDVLANPSVLSRLALLIPLTILHQGIFLVEGSSARIDDLVQRVVGALMATVSVSVISALCNAINDVYSKTDHNRTRPIKGYMQVVRLIALIIGALLVVASLLGKSPWFLLSGLGAMTAVLMLVFRDTILGFVAGVQLTANGLIHVGDWVEMPQFSADGDVIDIALNVVQIQNWDKTITAIPAHKFLENSFKNWRGMQQSGGRRIARSLDIDLTSVRFVDDALLERLQGLQLLAPFLRERSAEIAAWNQEKNINAEVPGNGRRMTNIGCFRAYVIAYLKSNPKIRQDMTFLVRQLAPGATGLPLQIYVFTSTTVWAEYEAIQSDLFDHLYAILPHFDLHAFQHPTGNDFHALAKAPADT
jgi:miniconductance mechanosensitive channel